MSNEGIPIYQIKQVSDARWKYLSQKNRKERFKKLSYHQNHEEQWKYNIVVGILRGKIKKQEVQTADERLKETVSKDYPSTEKRNELIYAIKSNLKNGRVNTIETVIDRYGLYISARRFKDFKKSYVDFILQECNLI